MSEPHSAEARRPRRLPIDAGHPGWVMLVGKVLSGSVRLDGALCRGKAKTFDAADEASRRAAVELCSRCPVLNECRLWVASLSPCRRPPGVVGATYRFRGGGTT